MLKNTTQKFVTVTIGILLVLAVMAVVKGCKRDRNRLTAPIEKEDEVVYLNFPRKAAPPNAKVTGGTVTVTDTHPTEGGVVDTASFGSLPANDVPLSWKALEDHCDYTLTATATLSSGGTVSATPLPINACVQTAFTLIIDWGADTSEPSQKRAMTPVTISAAAQRVASLAELRGTLRASGVDIAVSSKNQVFMVEFSEPVTFAALKLDRSTGAELLKALDASGTVKDMDVGATDLYVFGKGIVALELAEGRGPVKELRFIPEL